MTPQLTDKATLRQNSRMADIRRLREILTTHTGWVKITGR